MLFSKKFTFITCALIIIIICCTNSCYGGLGDKAKSVLRRSMNFRRSPKLSLSWKRPTTIEFPHVWHKFETRDLNNKTIEYRIEDLHPSRTKDVFKHMRDNYLREEPICQVYGVADDDLAVKDMELCWSALIEQKMPLVCYKAGSDEIIGANMNFVITKDDTFMEDYKKLVKSDKIKATHGLEMFLYDDYDPFKAYKIDKYLTSLALSVDKKYRGRGIGEQFLATRKKVCKEFGIKLTQTAFSSMYSSRNADNVGFKTDTSLKFKDVVAKHPEYAILKNITAEEFVIKTLICK